ncbi:MAG: RidA family protein [Candidatus Binatia bacterium]
MAEKKILQPANIWNTQGLSFSQGVVVKGGSSMIFVAGQAAFDKDGHVVGKGDITQQTQVTLENVKSVLESAGASLEDVVRITVFLTDIRNMSVMQRVRADYFRSNYPASTGVQVSSLAHEDLLVEIDAIAVK